MNNGHWLFRYMPHFGYDLALYQGITNLIWRCPTNRLLDNYAEHLSSNHLELGVGTGYFLKRTACVEHMRRLTLLDLSKNCLRRSAKRLKPLNTEAIQHDLLTRFPKGVRGYRSIGMNFVLHCLPANKQRLADLLGNIHSSLRPQGVFFGATLTPINFERAPLANLLMWSLQKTRIFNNQTHSVEKLTKLLQTTFSKVHVERVGHAVLFAAWK